MRGGGPASYEARPSAYFQLKVNPNYKVGSNGETVTFRSFKRIESGLLHGCFQTRGSHFPAIRIVSWKVLVDVRLLAWQGALERKTSKAQIGELREQLVTLEGGLAKVHPNLISHKMFIKSFCKSQFPHESVN